MPLCAKCVRVYVEKEGNLCDVCRAISEGKVVITDSGQPSEFRPKGEVDIYWMDRRPPKEVK